MLALMALAMSCGPSSTDAPSPAPSGLGQGGQVPFRPSQPWQPAADPEPRSDPELLGCLNDASPNPTAPWRCDVELCGDDRCMPTVVYLPASEPAKEDYPAVVLVHGKGSWQDKKHKWLPMAEALAERGFVAAYPDVRIADPVAGPDDCVLTATWLRAQTAVEVAAVGIIGGSMGNLSALTAVQRHPDDFSAYVNLYGALADGPWGHTKAGSIEAMRAATLIQVGSEDPKPLLMASILFEQIGQRNPSLHHSLRVYDGGKHGFIFRNNNAGQQGQLELVQFLDWALREPDAPAPSWYQ